MTPDQLDQIKEVIKETVNGKIDLLSFKLESHIVADTEWKKEVQPVIELGKNSLGFGKGITYFMGMGAMLGAIITAIVEIFKKVK